MVARIFDTESHFKAGDTMALPKSPLLKKLTYAHCAKLRVGERIWFPSQEAGMFTAATVTTLQMKESTIEMGYTAGNSSGFRTISPKGNCNGYRFLDEEYLVEAKIEEVPRLRVVGED